MNAGEVRRRFRLSWRLVGASDLWGNRVPGSREGRCQPDGVNLSGAFIHLRVLDQEQLAGDGLVVALSFLLLLREAIELVRLRRKSTFNKDVEILLLRHQLEVLRRKAPRTRFTWADSAWLGACPEHC